MRKYLGYLIIIMMIFLLAGCGNEKTTDEQTGDASSSKPQTQNVQEHLFEAKDMDSIELSGQDIIDGKEANMSVKISNDINMEFHISRDNPNGTKLYAIYNSQATNLAVNYISPDVFDNDEAIPSYYYQICCYDFNKDGIKEVVIACGNKSNELSIFVFGVNIDTDFEFMLYPINTILGDKNAYVNESNEICVPSIKGDKAYKYNVKAEDANYAKQSGPIKISVDYATMEQLGKYKSINQFVKDEEGSTILILPTETLKDVTVYTIEYNVDSDSHYATNELYKVPTISPEEPLVLQYQMPDFPILGVSYVDESGTKQFCGIGESLMDGSIFLFEMGIAKG